MGQIRWSLVDKVGGLAFYLKGKEDAVKSFKREIYIIVFVILKDYSSQ